MHGLATVNFYMQKIDFAKLMPKIDCLGRAHIRKNTNKKIEL